MPVASGSDAGGSLRNPAAWCNVVGFRPSIGRVPNPSLSVGWSTLSTNGCLGRSTADLALALSTIAGPDLSSPLSIDEPGSVFARSLDRSFKGVRVAWFKNLNGIPIDPRVRTVVDAQRKTFESLGCIVEEAEPDFAPAEISFRILRVWSAAAAHSALFKAHPDGFKDTLRGEIEEGLALSAADITRAEVAHTLLWRRFQAFLASYEYFILPTTQLPPFDVNTPWPTEINGVHFANYIDWMKSCWYISATGNPAVSVPAGFTAEGLPVGLQIVGRDKQDFSVLQLAHAFEHATNFGNTTPPHCPKLSRLSDSLDEEGVRMCPLRAHRTVPLSQCGVFPGKVRDDELSTCVQSNSTITTESRANSKATSVPLYQANSGFR